VRLFFNDRNTPKDSWNKGLEDVRARAERLGRLREKQDTINLIMLNPTLRPLDIAQRLQDDVARAVADMTREHEAEDYRKKGLQPPR
jgi:hypothetical protein